MFDLKQERTGQVSTYSGSSSDAMSEIGGPRSTLRSRTGTVINDRKTSNSGVVKRYVK